MIREKQEEEEKKNNKKKHASSVGAIPPGVQKIKQPTFKRGTLQSYRSGSIPRGNRSLNLGGKKNTHTHTHKLIPYTTILFSFKKKYTQD